MGFGRYPDKLVDSYPNSIYYYSVIINQLKTMPQIQREKTAVLSVSLAKSLDKNAKRFAKKEEISVSQLVSKALKNYIFSEDWENLRRAFRPLAKKLKIETDADVERIFSKRT